jgi:hypothetical protein
MNCSSARRPTLNSKVSCFVILKQIVSPLMYQDVEIFISFAQYSHSIFTVLARYFQSTCTVLSQFFYSTFTVLSQYFYGTCTVLSQYLHGTFTIFSQYLHGTFTVLSQYLHSTCTVLSQYFSLYAFLTHAKPDFVEEYLGLFLSMEVPRGILNSGLVVFCAICLFI